MAEITIPDEERQALEQVAAAAEGAFGADLCGLMVFGSATRGAYVPGRSDLNLLVVLREAQAEGLRRFADAVAKARETVRLEPYVLRRDEVPLLARHFPTRLWDMCRSYVALKGEDVLAGLSPGPEAIQARAEQELFNLLLRLRHALATPSERPWAQTLAGCVRVFTKSLRHLLLAIAGEHVEGRSELFQRAAATWGLDTGVLLQLDAWRAGRVPFTEEEARVAAELLLEAVGKAVVRHD
jgi:predicted nucleotidyltransferase